MIVKQKVVPKKTKKAPFAGLLALGAFLLGNPKRGKSGGAEQHAQISLSAPIAFTA